MNKINYIYFDLGGVLFKFEGGLSKIAQEENRKYEDFVAVFKKYDDLVCRGEMSPDDLWKKYQEEISLKPRDNFDFTDFWTDNFEPIVEMHTFVRETTQTHKVGLLTNIYSGVFPVAVKKKAIPDLSYEAIIQSCEVGYAKPEHEIYELATRKANCDPSTILFVDDKENFLTPARELGWKTILFDTQNPNKSIDEIFTLLGA